MKHFDRTSNVLLLALLRADDARHIRASYGGSARMSLPALDSIAFTIYLFNINELSSNRLQ